MLFYDNLQIYKKRIKIHSREILLEVRLDTEMYSLEFFKNHLKKSLRYSYWGFKRKFRSVIIPLIIKSLEIESNRTAQILQIGHLFIKICAGLGKDVAMHVPEPFKNGKATIEISVFYLLDVFLKNYESHPKLSDEFCEFFLHELVHAFDLKLVKLVERYNQYTYNEDLASLIISMFVKIRLESITELRTHLGKLIPIESIFTKNLRESFASLAEDASFNRLTSQRLADFEHSLEKGRYSYRMGLQMAAMIALALLKRKGQIQDVFLIVGDDKISWDIEELNHLFSSDDRLFYLSPLPDTSIAETIAFIYKMDDQRFVRTYVISCNILGLSDENRFINMEMYSNFRNQLPEK